MEALMLVVAIVLVLTIVLLFAPMLQVFIGLARQATWRDWQDAIPWLTVMVCLVAMPLSSKLGATVIAIVATGVVILLGPDGEE
jgi:hypothetical protein